MMPCEPPKRRRGGQPKPPGEHLVHNLYFKVSEKDLALVRAAAVAEGQTVARFCRDSVVGVAGVVVDEVYP